MSVKLILLVLFFNTSVFTSQQYVYNDMEPSTRENQVPILIIVTTAAYQYSEVIPSIAAAIEDVNALYTGKFLMRFVSFTNKTKFFCEVLAEDTIDLSAAHYYNIRRSELSKGLPVFISPFCTADFLMVARLTSEWNVPVISTIGSFQTDELRYPTAATIGPAHNTVFVNFVKRFLLYYKWTTIFLLCDDKRDVGFFRATCDTFKRQLLAPTFKVPFVNFDSGTEVVNYDTYLGFVQKSARVVFLLCRSELARHFMIHAQRKNMTNSEYVYLVVTPYTLLPSYPEMSWAKGDNEITTTTSRQILLVTYDNDDVAGIPPATLTNIRQKIRQAGFTNFSTSNKLAATMACAYSAVTLLAKAVNETINSTNGTSSILALQNGAGIIQRLLNRSFKIPTGTVYVSPGGQRHADMLVKQFNPSTGEMEISPGTLFNGQLIYLIGDCLSQVLRYTYRINTLRFDRNISWSSGNVPLNEPLCGYDGGKCIAVPQVLPASVLAPAILFGLVIILGGAVCLAWCLQRTAQAHKHPWWKLQSEILYYSQNRRRTLASKMLSSIKTSYLPFV